MKKIQIISTLIIALGLYSLSTPLKSQVPAFDAQIKSVNGMCLDTLFNRMFNWPVTAFYCWGEEHPFASNQIFNYYPESQKLLIRDQCVHIYGNTNAGALLDVSNCNEPITSSEQWVFTPSGQLSAGDLCLQYNNMNLLTMQPCSCLLYTSPSPRDA